MDNSYKSISTSKTVYRDTNDRQYRDADLQHTTIFSPAYLTDLLATVHSQKRASCSKSAAGLLLCCHQVDIRMRLHRLLRLDDNKSAAS